MIQIVVRAAATSRQHYITYRFDNIEQAQTFVEDFKLEGKIVDIIIPE